MVLCKPRCCWMTVALNTDVVLGQVVKGPFPRDTQHPKASLLNRLAGPNSTAQALHTHTHTFSLQAPSDVIPPARPTLRPGLPTPTPHPHTHTLRLRRIDATAEPCALLVHPHVLLLNAPGWSKAVRDDRVATASTAQQYVTDSHRHPSCFLRARPATGQEVAWSLHKPVAAPREARQASQPSRAPPTA